MNKFKAIIIATILVIAAVCLVGCDSAYDVAVKNGYSGSEQQWLASLKGKDGKDGADLDIMDIYEAARNNGFEGSYLEFLDKYLDFTVSEDNSESIAKAMRSAMLVECGFTRRSLRGEEQFQQAGAGVIYTLNRSAKTAYIITNYHVVYSSTTGVTANLSEDISVFPYDGEELAATYIGGSATYDIAVLKVQNDYFTTDFPTPVTVDSLDVTVGQTAIAIGNPAGAGLSVTEGIVSVDSEYIELNGIENPSESVSMRVMRIDTAVNSGNSGGGLFNGNGDFIGVVNAKSSDTSIENMGYAIPASIAVNVANNIIKNGNFMQGFVGITVSSENAKAYLDESGVVRISETVNIEEVDGAADNILAAGDKIVAVKVGDEEVVVTRRFHVIDAILAASPGDTVTFTVLRGGSEMNFDVTLRAKS